jgi:hypothetical protein
MADKKMQDQETGELIIAKAKDFWEKKWQDPDHCQCDRHLACGWLVCLQQTISRPRKKQKLLK